MSPNAPTATEHRNSTTRILLADDHPVVRIGVRNMLRAEGHFDVVGEASDGDEAITQTLELLPDILLLDLSMPRMPGPGGDARYHERLAAGEDPAADRHHLDPADH